MNLRRFSPSAEGPSGNRASAPSVPTEPELPLSAADYKAILRALPELYRLRDLADLPPLVLRLLQSLIPHTFSTYNEFDLRTGGVVLIYEPKEWQQRMDPLMATGHRLVAQNPLYQYMNRADDCRTVMISDFVSEEEWCQTDFYRHFLARIGIAETLLISLQLSKRALIFICLNRPRRDFTERDRSVADLLQPHLVAAYENAVAFTEACALALLSTRAIDESPHGIALLEASGRIVHINTTACELLPRFFGGSAGWSANLPPALRAWLRRRSEATAAPSTPFETTAGDRKLLCRVADAGEGRRLLLLQETDANGDPGRLRTLGLTRREADVLHWMTEGKSNGDVAKILGISRRTVEKHTEAIYARLGVETRTAALLKAMSVR